MGGRGSSSATAKSNSASFDQYRAEVTTSDVITRKQAGVLFRAYKSGELDVTKQQIDLVYTRFASESPHFSTNSHDQNSAANLKTVINALFAGDKPAANAAFGHFLSYYYTWNKDKLFPDDRR